MNPGRKKAQFRPCIDLHDGKVKQIVGSTLSDSGNGLKTNFIADRGPAWFADSTGGTTFAAATSSSSGPATTTRRKRHWRRGPADCRSAAASPPKTPPCGWTPARRR